MLLHGIPGFSTEAVRVLAGDTATLAVTVERPVLLRITYSVVEVAGVDLLVHPDPYDQAPGDLLGVALGVLRGAATTRRA